MRRTLFILPIYQDALRCATALQHGLPTSTIRVQPRPVVAFGREEFHYVWPEIVRTLRGERFDEIHCSLDDSDEFGNEILRPLLASTGGKLVIHT